MLRRPRLHGGGRLVRPTKVVRQPSVSTHTIVDGTGAPLPSQTWPAAKLGPWRSSPSAVLPVVNLPRCSSSS